MTSATLALSSEAAGALAHAAADCRAITVAHHLSSQAAASDAQLREIIAALPSTWWQTVDGAVDRETPSPPAQVAGRLPVDSDVPVVTRIFHVQLCAALRSLCESVFAELAQTSIADGPWTQRDAGLVLLSGEAVVAAHASHHHTLMMLLSGDAEVGIALPGSREHASVLARSGPRLHCRSIPPGARTHEIHAGQALYIPPFAVHWLRSPVPAAALSFGWITAATTRAEDVHAANAVLLRRLRLPATPVGGFADPVKLRIVAAAKRSRSLIEPGHRPSATP